ncbi:MAG: UPF0175 family protein [archaeon]
MEEDQILENMSELQKYIVLLLKANNRELIKGNTWFQKELFLISKNIPSVAEEASFEADMYGPFSETAEEELEELGMDDVVLKSGNKVFLSSLGDKIAAKIKSNISKEEFEMISEFKTLLNDLNPEEVLTLIYFTFPNMTQESLVLDNIKKHRKKIAIELYKKGKISLQRASEIADLPLEIFVEEIKNI